MRPHLLKPVTVTSASREVHLWSLKLYTKYAVYELLLINYGILFIRHYKNDYSVKYRCVSLTPADGDGFIFFHITVTVRPLPLLPYDVFR